MKNSLISNKKIIAEKTYSSISAIMLCSLFLLLFLSFIKSVFAEEPSLSVDVFMGGTGRSDLQQRISNMVFEDGRSYGWEDFSAWGEEIFFESSVQNPPTGSRPSEPVSTLFKCARCHNHEREDPVLTVLDPEARFRWIEKTGKELFLIQGTTMWGVVNRETYYPDYFSVYHDLCVPKGKEVPWLPCGPLLGICRPGCRTMNPDSLEDAIQVCSNYCSVGRYLEQWELYSLMAFFWDKEITIEDLNLLPEEAFRVKAVLASPSPDPLEIAKLQRLLAGKYSKKADNTYRGIPVSVIEDSHGNLVVDYEDGSKFIGDSARGERLWKLSCARCHAVKGPITAEKAKHLTEDLDELHEMLAKGTRHSFSRYMPNFTLQRLSRQQSADILKYLKHVAR